jgi:hypothetical protein
MVGRPNAGGQLAVTWRICGDQQGQWAEGPGYCATMGAAGPPT